MARISTYAIDTNITAQDKVIGTDPSGAVTKNFNLADLGEFLTRGYVNVNGQHSWKFVDQIQPGGLFGPVNGAAINSLTTVKVNEVTAGDKNIQNFLLEYKAERILLVDIAEPNNYGVFDITSIVEDEDNLNNYDIGLEYVSGNGALVLEKIYSISIYAQAKLRADKTFVFTQTTPSAVWTINHGLNKFPSVTSVNNNNIQAYGAIEYVDKNNLTITFSGGFSGKAYMN